MVKHDIPDFIDKNHAQEVIFLINYRKYISFGTGDHLYQVAQTGIRAYGQEIGFYKLVNAEPRQNRFVFVMSNQFAPCGKLFGVDA